MSARLEVALLTREFPPEVYGGAGVHVDHLSRALAPYVSVAVHAFGKPRSGGLVRKTYASRPELDGSAPHLGALRTLDVDVSMAAGVAGADIVHTHTWYANFAGYLAKLLYGIPHVMTSHSLEPLRPWKAEQLGGGYAVSCFAERIAIENADAVVAVSAGMREDILRVYPMVDPDCVHVIHNGVDAERYAPDRGTNALERLGIDPSRPSVVFLGRITRQKGLVHLLDAMQLVHSPAQLVLCAGEADTEALAIEVRNKVTALEATRGDVRFIEAMLPREDIVQILSHATVFVCPSVYEPFGLVNVEAMACGAAVVATRVGGIPEIVVEGETGFLVPFEPNATGDGPADAGRLAHDLAAPIERLLENPDAARAMGARGRARVVEHFGWDAIARRTSELYRALADEKR